MHHRIAQKPFNEMSPQNITRQMAAASGMPEPGKDATEEERQQWDVASLFIIYLRSVPYEDNPAAAKIAAANTVLSVSGYQKLLPYIEMGLGRQLTEAEIAARKISFSL